MLFQLLQKVRDKYEQRRYRKFVQERHAGIYRLERKRSAKATIHQLQIVKEVRRAVRAAQDVPLSSLIDQETGNRLHWARIVIQPTLRIPPILLQAFPFPFTPDRERNSGECTSPTCPVVGPHLTGLYYHNLGLSAELRGLRSQWFGNSEAPRTVWDAVDRLTTGERYETFDQDVKLVREFRNCHYYTFREQGEWNADEATHEAWKAYRRAVHCFEMQQLGADMIELERVLDIDEIEGTETLGALVDAGTALATMGLSAAVAAGIRAAHAAAGPAPARAGPSRARTGPSRARTGPSRAPAHGPGAFDGADDTDTVYSSPTVSEGLDIVNEGLDIATKGLDFATAGLRVVNEGFDIVNKGLDVEEGLDVVTEGGESSPRWEDFEWGFEEGGESEREEDGEVRQVGVEEWIWDFD